MTIVLCANGYPGSYVKDKEIKNLPEIISDKNNQIFHAGTYKKDNKIFSKGGRVLNVTCLAESLEEARAAEATAAREASLAAEAASEARAAALTAEEAAAEAR